MPCGKPSAVQKTLGYEETSILSY